VPCSHRACVSQHPPVHHPNIPVLGFHGWDETVPPRSVYLVSSFFFFFFNWPFFFSHFYFCPAILEPKFFSAELLPTPSTYLPLQPTYLPSTTQPIYLPLPTLSQPHFGQVWGEAQHLEKLGLGVLRNFRMFRVRQQGPKHLALGSSWCHWKGLET
jgi:hypothetical protein